MLTLNVTNPGSTALLGSAQTAIATFDVTVVPTADAPTFSPGSTRRRMTVAGFADLRRLGDERPGEPPNQSNLNGLSFATTNDNKVLFAVQPAVALVGNTAAP